MVLAKRNYSFDKKGIKQINWKPINPYEWSSNTGLRIELLGWYEGKLDCVRYVDNKLLKVKGHDDLG